MRPVPPRETCATTAVRRWSLVIPPRLMAKESTTCWPLRSPRFDVSMNTPVALRFTALQSLRRPPGTVMYTMVRARCLVCSRRSTAIPRELWFVFILLVWAPGHYALQSVPCRGELNVIPPPSASIAAQE